MFTEIKATDPTNGNLAAALLDQKVAGAFHGQKYAYTPVLNNNGYWGLGIAVEDEAGYNPIQSAQFRWKSQADARDFCRGMNKHIGLFEEDETRIVCSTMRSTSRRRW